MNAQMYKWTNITDELLMSIIESYIRETGNTNKLFLKLRNRLNDWYDDLSYEDKLRLELED